MTKRDNRIFNRIEMPPGLEQSRARPFFNRATGRAFDVRTANNVTEIDIYDEIGAWGVDAKMIRDQLKGAGDVSLRINSPGGDVFDGIAIHNDLLDHAGAVTVTVTGVAASAASIIAMAGDEIRIAENAFLMIHNAWTLYIGDKREFLKAAGILDQIDTALAETYAKRTGMDLVAIAAMMDAETWIGAAKAVEDGFADDVSDSDAATARAQFDLTGYRNTPDSLRKTIAAGAEPTVRDLERALRDAGLARSDAKALISRGRDASSARDAATEVSEEVRNALQNLTDTIKKGSKR